jgi:hypothetical protein
VKLARQYDQDEKNSAQASNGRDENKNGVVTSATCFYIYTNNNMWAHADENTRLVTSAAPSIISEHMRYVCLAMRTQRATVHETHAKSQLIIQ